MPFLGCKLLGALSLPWGSFPNSSSWPQDLLRPVVSPSATLAPSVPMLYLWFTLSLLLLNLHTGSSLSLALLTCAKVCVLVGGGWVSLAPPRPLSPRSCVWDGPSSRLVFFLEAVGGGSVRAGHSRACSTPEEMANLVLRIMQKDDTGCGSLNTTRPRRLLFPPDEITKKRAFVSQFRLSLSGMEHPCLFS